MEVYIEIGKIGKYHRESREKEMIEISRERKRGRDTRKIRKER